MIQTINITKSYKSKTGATVAALKGVSIKFPTKGMVFILGKSGSGKSTLLNVLGGLDSYDSGELLIKGQSTKSFSQTQYDSYRNTFIGFIFQEYNLLDNFSIGENIALAMRLQNHKVTNEEIFNILKKVDLDGVIDRKPNELSGGQKQRVAIARALIKNPQVILADEPTGALDSKTGLQIFDLLKELSKEKLVIIISHDREFSEKFADRIIELKDGEVISDVSASKAAKKGKPSFKTTNTTDIESDNSGYHLIKSRLPLKHAFKMGVSGLKHKKLKLAFTLLLSTISFTLLGISASMALINKTDIQTQLLAKSDVKFNNIEKNLYKNQNYYEVASVPMDTDDINNIESGLRGVPHKFLGAISATYEKGGSPYGNQTAFNFSNNINIKWDKYDTYKYTTQANYFATYDSGNPDEYSKLGLSLKKRDVTELKEKEIFISDYLLETFGKFDYIEKDGGGTENPQHIDVDDMKGDNESIINKEITLSSYTTSEPSWEEHKFTVKITNVFTTNFHYNDSKYQEVIENRQYDSKIGQEYNYYKNKSFANAIFASEETIEQFAEFLNEEALAHEYSSTTHYDVSTQSCYVNLENNAQIKQFTKLVNQNYVTKAERAQKYIQKKYDATDQGSQDLENKISMFNNMRPIFLYIGLGLILFSGLLFANFIANSISYQKKEIGILRAIGSRSKDVFKIYFSESFVMAITNFVLATVASLLLVTLVLNPKMAFIAAGVNVLSFGIIEIGLILGVSLVAAFLSTILPVYMTAKKRPVEAIRLK